MASSTTNLDLTLPVGGEHVSRQIINANNVKIDEAVGPVPSGTDLQSQVTALNNKITRSGTTTLTYYNGPYDSGITNQLVRWYRCGNIVVVTGSFKLSGTPDASTMYAVFTGLPYASTTDFVGIARISNNGKLLSGIKSVSGDSKCAIYFLGADGTYPVTGNTIEITLIYATADA